MVADRRKFSRLSKKSFWCRPLWHFFLEELHNDGSSDGKFSKGESFGFDWSGAGRMVETNEDLLDGVTGIMTENDPSFAATVRQLLLKKK